MAWHESWTPELQNDLLAPFGTLGFLPRGKGITRAGLAYIEARDVMNRLDQTVGPASWQFTYSIEVLNDKKAVVNGILTVHGVSRWDAGEADGEAELLKSAISDALKRCAVHFGIGRYLYYLPTCFGEYDEGKRSWARGKEPMVKSADLAVALGAVGYTLPSGRQLPEVRTVEAPANDPRPVGAFKSPARTPTPQNGHNRAPESRGDAAAVADWKTRTVAKLKQLFPTAEGAAAMHLAIASAVLGKPVETFEGWEDGRHWRAYLERLEKLTKADVNRIISEAFAASASAHPAGALALDDVFDPAHPCQQVPAAAQGA